MTRCARSEARRSSRRGCHRRQPQCRRSRVREFGAGKISSVRWLHLLLISLLFAGQVHLCQASYRLPTGRECSICPTLDAHPFEFSSTVSDSHDSNLIAGNHGDCHDCCQIRGCSESDGHGQSALQSVTFGVYFICFPTRFEFSFATLPQLVSVAVHIESAPATGPPSPTSSRAPPASSRHQTSAGRGILRLA